MSTTPPPPPPAGGQPPVPPGPPPPMGGGMGAAPTGTNPFAIGSLIASIVGVCCGIGSIIGIILGFVALNQIKTTGQNGKGMAQAGIIIGIVTFVIGVIYFIWAISSGGGTFYYSN